MSVYHGVCRVCAKFITVRQEGLFVAGAIKHKDKMYFALSCNMLQDKEQHHNRLDLIKAYDKVDKDYKGYY